MKTVSVLPSEYIATFLLGELRKHGRGDFKQHHAALVDIACSVRKTREVINELLAYLSLKNCGKHQDLRKDIYSALVADTTWQQIRADEDDLTPVFGNDKESIKLLTKLKAKEYLVRDAWTENGKVTGSPFKTSTLKVLSPGELGTRMAQCVNLACNELAVADGIAEMNRAVSELVSLADDEVLAAFDEQAKALGLRLPARKFDPFEL
jgi:hypothetical protein